MAPKKKVDPDGLTKGQRKARELKEYRKALLPKKYKGLNTTERKRKRLNMLRGEEMDPRLQGRPEEYRESYDDLVFNYGLLGATEAEMAAFFGVSTEVFDSWKNNQPTFLEALMSSKAPADARVARSLYHRAIGMQVPDTHVAVYFGKVIKTRLIKHIVPDTKAAALWLANRRPDRWRLQPSVGEDDGGPTPPPTKVEITVKDARVRTQTPRTRPGQE